MILCRKSAHVVTLVDYFEIEGETFIVSKYAPGGDLCTYLNKHVKKNNQLSEEQTQLIMHQLAKGVRDIHKQGLVHKDLKLLNVFIQSDGDHPKIKIGDFGLACKLEGTEIAGKKSGTLAFMAPEVILGHPFDQKVDIWALGIILYSLLTQEHPFGNNLSNHDLKKKIAYEPFTTKDKALWNISSECKHLLTMMLRKDKDNRPSIESVLAHSWF